MKTYTVKELANLAGVSVRTLHHYDDIGLLKPERVGENEYRYYGQRQLHRLQQILIYRELDMSLSDIAAVLDSSSLDRTEILEEQRKRLKTQINRFEGIIETIDKTLTHLRYRSPMTDTELYTGIVHPERQAEYENWLVDHYGAQMKTSIEHSKKEQANWSKDDIDAAMMELKQLEQGLADSMREGIAAENPENYDLLEEHCDWVSKMWGKPCPPDAYASLADLYLSHPDFGTHYESIAPGFTVYLTDAMKAWSAVQSKTLS